MKSKWDRMTVSYTYEHGEFAGSYCAPYDYPLKYLPFEDGIQYLRVAGQREGVCITLYTDRFYSSMTDSCPQWYGDRTPLLGDVEYRRLATKDFLPAIYKEGDVVVIDETVPFVFQGCENDQKKD